MSRYNNAICFFVDSVMWDCISTNRAKVSPTPFLDSLKKEGLVANKLYSHGPYTDAATRSLFTGRNCLDDFGYYFKLNTSPITHYKLFHDAGYETYDFHYPYYIKGNKINEAIDHRIYTGGFEFGSEWGGLYYYYNEIIRNRELNNTELSLLQKRIEYMFESWMLYLKDAITNPESLLMHKQAFDNYDVLGALEILNEEYNKFISGQKDYIIDFISKGLSHRLATLDSTTVEAYMSPQFMIEYVEKKYKKLFQQISRANFKANFINNLPSLKRILWGCKELIRKHDKSGLHFLMRYILNIRSMRQMSKFWKKPRWQYGHSARVNYDLASEIIGQRDNTNKPFYMFFHVGEPHYKINFFTYDVQDEAIIDEEMAVIQDYVDQLGVHFKGDLTYLLSLRYSDYQIERFCNRLKDMGFWDNTSILVISDHGTSHSGFPLHNKLVNCFDEECYHIPMLIRHPGMNPVEINTYQYSKDVFPTFADILGIPQSEFFKGRSMLKETEPRPYIVTEYMGPGCPDISSRRIWFSARDSHFIVAYKVGIYEEFAAGELAEVYDLAKDPNGYYNINDSVDRSRIQYLLDAIKERYEEIKRDTEVFLNEIASKER